MRSRLASRKRLVALIASLRSENWRLEDVVREQGLALHAKRAQADELREALLKAEKWAEKWERIAAERRNWINPDTNEGWKRIVDSFEAYN